jgi:hypothetical protein
LAGIFSFTAGLSLHCTSLHALGLGCLHSPSNGCLHLHSLGDYTRGRLRRCV